jgi:serine/threonine-protein kinase
MLHDVTDRNLLFGVLALQAGFLDADQFAEACSAWATRKDKPLAELLVHRGLLSAQDRLLVDQLLERKIEKHSGDVHESLATVTSNGTRHVLAKIADEEVQKTVADLSGRNGTPPDHPADIPTVTYSAHSREQYTLSRLHRNGGIGRVWIARDNDMEREVALKELHPEYAHRDDLKARFIAEAKITGQLQHPGIVPVHELARQSADGQPFYTMRFISGRTMSEAIGDYHYKRNAGKASTIELRELLAAFISVCNTVAYAHSRRVIHRDLKPLNIVMGDFGEAMVLDWGLAKVIGADEPPKTRLPVALAHDAWRTPTELGQFIGTPGYCSPEQAEGRLDILDERSDVYSLGACLYQLLTERAPFVGKTTEAILEAVSREPPTLPRDIVSDTPRGLEAICLKALAKKPGDRYQSAKDLARDVERWLADEPVEAYREPWYAKGRRWVSRHQTLVWTAAATVLVAALSSLAWNGALMAANERERDAKELALERQRDAERDAEAQKLERWASAGTTFQGLPSIERMKLLRQAQPIWEELIRDHPADASYYQMRLGLNWFAQGIYVFNTYEPDASGSQKTAHEASEKAFAKSYSVLHSLLEKAPDNREIREACLWSLKDLGFMKYRNYKTEEGIADIQVAVSYAEQFARTDPSFDGMLASFSEELGRYYEEVGKAANAHTVRLLALRARQRDVGKYVRGQAHEDVYLGGFFNTCKALARLLDYSAALEGAQWALNRHPNSGDTLHDCACVYTLAARACLRDTNLTEAQRRSRSEEMTQQAVKLLRQSVDLGFRNANVLKNDRDLEDLRQRPDVKRIIESLETPAGLQGCE